MVRAIEEPYRAMLAAGTGARPLGPRFVDDTEVTDHHAIIPTEKEAPGDLPPGEKRILRPRVPAPALGVARRSRLRGHERHHRDRESRSS